MNKAMERKLKDGKAVDISQHPRDPNGYYLLPKDFNYKDTDLCDAVEERWVWSVGKRPDGQLIASLAGDLYQRPGIECVWLR